MALKLLLRRYSQWAAFSFAAVLGALPIKAQDVNARPKGAPRRLVAVPLQRDFGRAKSKTTTDFRQPEALKKLAGQDLFELCLTTNKFDSPDAAQVDPSIPKIFELLCYNGQRVGPTIRVQRNSKLRVHLLNQLHGGKDSDPGPVVGAPEGEMPHGFGTTNLHTHGLHVSPQGKSDNVFQRIEPGKDLYYEIQIGEQHPSGTFWYHPHKHGSVAYQLANGVAGALIVEGDAACDRDLESIPEIAAASEHGAEREHNHEQILVLQLYTYLVSDSDGIGRIDANQIYNIQPSQATPINATGGAPVDPPVQITAINGLINPTFTIAPGEVQRWRIIHAGWDLLRQLIWVDDQDQPVADLKFVAKEIAVDGLATGTMTATMTNDSPLQIAPGQRSDVLIQVPPDSQGKTYHLKQRPVPNALATHGRGTDANYLAKLVVEGIPQNMELPNLKNSHVVAKLAKCRAYGSIQDSELTPPPLDDMGNQPPFPNRALRFLANDAIRTYTINGQTFHQTAPMTLKIRDVEEWSLTALLGSHPFHIHVNPFQVMSYTEPSGFTVPMNVWRDTLYIPEGASYTIRTRFQDFPGDSVLHCHILDHEDQGMMMCLRFTDSENSGAVEGPGCETQSLVKTSASAPSLKLPDVFGKDHQLAEFRQCNTVLVFFRGVGCPHCTDQLRDLLGKARGPNGLDAEILAVSSEAIDDASQALKDLGAVDSDRFHLLVDARRNAFRDFDCYKGDDPKHGLFLIDRKGVIRASYRGELPFGNTQEVIRQVRQLLALNSETDS
jgi:FtsP/CotA-like multicopper oxidase with cupredoxin domain/peroxiredoxin